MQAKIEQLNNLLKQNPNATHIYVKRVGMDGLIVDVPVAHVKDTLRRQPLWEIVSSNKTMDAEMEALFLDLPLPEKPGETWVDTPVVPPAPEPVSVTEPITAPKPKRGRPKANA